MKLLKFSLIFFLLLFPSDWANACLNLYGTSIFGKEVENEVEHEGDEYYLFFREYERRKKEHKTQEKLKEYQEKIKKDTSFQVWTDYAVLLIFAGQPEKAIEILLKIEKKVPNQYNTAINLGTAYELVGNNEKALYWIKRGLELNLNSHYGSEWIHVKILEAKIQMKKNPNWLKNHSILGIDFGKEMNPIIPNSLKRTERNEIELTNQLEYQLLERTFLVKPKDEIVAQLLFQLADLYAVEVGVEYAIPIYELSLEYGSLDKELINKRLAKCQEILNEKEWKESIKEFIEKIIGLWVVWIFGIVFLIFIYFNLKDNTYFRKGKNT